MRKISIYSLCLAVMGTVGGAGCGDLEIEEDNSNAGSSVEEDTPDGEGSQNRIVRLQGSDLSGLKYGNGMSNDITMTFTKPTQTVRDLQVGQVIVASEKDHTFIREILTLRHQNNGHTVWMWTTDVPLSNVLSPNHRERIRVNPASIKAFFKRADKSLYRDLNTRVQCVDCAFRFDPDFTFDFQMKGGRVKRFSTTVGSRIVGNFVIRVEGTPRTLQHTKKVPLYQQRFIQHIGPVPIWEDVSLIALVNVWLGKGRENVEFTTGFKSHRNSTSTLTYEGGKWTPRQHSNSSFDWISKGDVSGGTSRISFEARIELRLEIRVYSLAGIRIDAGLHGDYSFQACPSPGDWDAKGKMFVDLHSGLPYNGGFLFDEKRNLFQKNLRWDGQFGQDACRK